MGCIITDDGLDLYYEERGSGKPVIMVHGWTADHSWFEAQIEVLAERYRVIAVDLRGHGRSEHGKKTEYGMTLPRLARDIRDLMHTLDISKASMIGWSMGCMVLYDYIRQFGCDSIDRLILIDMSPKSVNEGDWTYGMQRKETYQAAVNWAAFCVQDWNKAAEVFVPTLFENGEPKDEELCERLITKVKSNVPHNMIFLLSSMSVSDYRPVLKDINVPVLLIHGEGSTNYGKEHGEMLKTMIPGSRLCILPGGHMMFIEYPEIFNDAMLSFLDEA